MHSGGLSVYLYLASTIGAGGFMLEALYTYRLKNQSGNFEEKCKRSEQTNKQTNRNKHSTVCLSTSLDSIQFAEVGNGYPYPKT